MKKQMKMNLRRWLGVIITLLGIIILFINGQQSMFSLVVGLEVLAIITGSLMWCLPQNKEKWFRTIIIFFVVWAIIILFFLFFGFQTF